MRRSRARRRAGVRLVTIIIPDPLVARLIRAGAPAADAQHDPAALAAACWRWPSGSPPMRERPRPWRRIPAHQPNSMTRTIARMLAEHRARTGEEAGEDPLAGLLAISRARIRHHLNLLKNRQR